MKKNRAVEILLIILMIYALFISISSKTLGRGLSASAVPVRRYKIYLITMDKMDQYWYSINEGAADMAALLDVTYIWDAPETKDTARQIEIIENAVQSGVDAILLAATDPVAVTKAVEDAKAQSIRMIYVDSPAYEQALVTLSTNNYEAGITAGKTMLIELENSGITSGFIGIIGVNTATASTTSRERGFRETINGDGRFSLLATEYHNGDPKASEEAAERFINDNSDLVGLFGSNEGSTEGVGNAIMDSKRNIIGIGFDKSDVILNLLNKGYLRAVIVQNPFTMGYLGMAEAYAALRGYDIGPSYIDTGVSILRRRGG